MNGITSAAQSAKSVQNTQTAPKTSSTSAYLAELRQKNPDVNITVANFANEKQFDSYMFSTGGANNVVLPTNILEQMAKDPAVAAKYEKLIGEMPDNAKASQKYADDHDQILYGSGMRIDRNGKVTYWAVGGEKTPRIRRGCHACFPIQNTGTKRSRKRQSEGAAPGLLWVPRGSERAFRGFEGA